MDRVRLARELGYSIDEKATVEHITFQDFDEQPYELVKLPSGVRSGTLHEELSAVIPPPPVVPVDDLRNQILLAVEMAVKTLLGDPDCPKDAVEADRMKTFSMKQRLGGFE